MSEPTLNLLSASAPNGQGEYFWSDADAVVAVPEKFAQQLLNIRHAGYSIAPAYDARPPRKQAVEKEVAPIEELQSVAPGVEPTSLGSALDLVAPKGTRAKKG